MNKKRQRYSAEFKAKVALSAIREEGTLSELSSKYQVNPNMVSKWKQQMVLSAKDIFSGKHEKKEITNEQQIKQLHAKIGELTVEKDFLEQASEKLNLFGGKRW